MNEATDAVRETPCFSAFPLSAARSQLLVILDYLDKRVAKVADPCVFGKPLRQSKSGLWRYRVRDFRIICQLRESQLIVLVVAVGHRSKIYEK